ncbi:MAG: ABC transporter permease [Cytophagales bacterium]|nr:ABC transporter permease [Cytophagales bacterium]
MIKNYLKIAARYLLRYRLYSFINIFGLTVGLTSSSLIFIYLEHQLSYDSFHHKSGEIARVIEIDERGEAPRNYARTSALTGPRLVEEYTDVVNQVRLYRPFGHLDIHWEGERVSERAFAFVDSTFFDLFDFEFIAGDKKTALLEPNSMVMSESMAKKYFGSLPALGELMEFQRMDPVKVTGIIKDIPGNSQLQLDILLTRNTGFRRLPWLDRVMNSWDSYMTVTYVQFASEAGWENVNQQVPSFVEKHRGENVEAGNFYLQPLEEVYLNSAHIEFDIVENKGNWFTIYLFSAIALFILLIASINYINLSTSRSMERSKEIGIRKVSGAARLELVYQFLSEAVLVSLLSFVLSIGLVDLLLDKFNEIAALNLTVDVFSFRTFALLLALAVFVGVLSGSYPALYLSQLNPSQSLKSGSFTKSSGAGLRRALVIIQFTLSIVMISATIIITQQMAFIKNKNLGFDKDRMLIVDINDSNVRQSFEAMKNEFVKVPGVKNAASSSRVPGEWKNITEIVVRPGSLVEVDSFQTYFMCFDEQMLPTYSLQLVEGRNFLGKLAEDSTSVLINETAARQLGGDDVIGQNLFLAGNDYPLEVVGVLKDFNFQSLHTDIAPLVVGYWSNPVTVIDYFSLKIEPGADISQTVAAARNVHEKFDNSTPMEFHFLDDQLNLFYRAEERTGEIFFIGATITILIACMGLFGLASFMVRKRLKEVSIRKVLGASPGQLFMLLSKSFFTHVLLSTLIAVPIGWWVMNGWLSNFSFRVSIEVWVFLLAGLAALVVALLTTSYQSVKATFLNPAETLKNE